MLHPVERHLAVVALSQAGSPVSAGVQTSAELAERLSRHVVCAMCIPSALQRSICSPALFQAYPRAFSRTGCVLPPIDCLSTDLSRVCQEFRFLNVRVLKDKIKAWGLKKVVSGYWMV